jgi:hypothetical protein
VVREADGEHEIGADEVAVFEGRQSGLRMEPSWTEPPRFTWEFIGLRECPECRRQSEIMPVRAPERC